MTLHTTARGKTIDMTALQLANEHVVALGNMGVNAKGDLLGPGGKVVKTRAEIMSEYHALKGGAAADDTAVQIPTDPLMAAKNAKQSTIEEDSIDDSELVTQLVAQTKAKAKK